MVIYTFIYNWIYIYIWRLTLRVPFTTWQLTLPNHHLQSAMPLSVPIVPSGTSVPFATCFLYEITYSSLLHIYLTCLYFFFIILDDFLKEKWIQTDSHIHLVQRQIFPVQLHLYLPKSEFLRFIKLWFDNAARRHLEEPSFKVKN